MESVCVQILHWWCIVIEATAALWVSVGFVDAFASLVMAHELATLRITAVIRTGLNYLIFSREIREWHDEEREAGVVTTIEAPFYAGPRPAQA